MAWQTSIEQLIRQISSGDAVAPANWPASAEISPGDLGLAEHSSGHLYWPEPITLLDATAIARSLPELDVSYMPIIDSTNTQLVNAGAGSAIANRLFVTEFQYGGKGRRGRRWLSPYARNLALSLGFGSTRALSELGGLSLVAGLALADLFDSLGIQGVELKWPNDVLVGGKKLSGILVELLQRQSSVEVVIGIGVNVEINTADQAGIDQAVTDIRRLGVSRSRTELVINLVQRIRAHLQLFEEQGFAPFVNAFNDLHAFHAQTCTVMQGQNSTTGTVLGIGEQGELILLTEQGEQLFHGGEVSLRSRSDEFR